MPEMVRLSVDLPTPFEPEHGDDLAWFDLQVDAAQHIGVAIAGVKATHRKQGIGAIAAPDFGAGLCPCMPGRRRAVAQIGLDDGAILRHLRPDCPAR